MFMKLELVNKLVITYGAYISSLNIETRIVLTITLTLVIFYTWWFVFINDHVNFVSNVNSLLNYVTIDNVNIWFLRVENDFIQVKKAKEIARKLEYLFFCGSSTLKQNSYEIALFRKSNSQEGFLVLLGKRRPECLTEYQLAIVTPDNNLINSSSILIANCKCIGTIRVF